MKKQLAVLSLTVAGLCAVPSLLRAEEAVPPKPPGSTEAPKPHGERPAGKHEGRRERGPGGPGDRLKMMTEKLDLTPDQQEKIKAIQEKNGAELKELMAKGRENLSEAEKTKARELMKSQMEEIRGVLTPAQQEKMKEMRHGGPGGDRKPGDRKPGERKGKPEAAN